MFTAAFIRGLIAGFGIAIPIGAIAVLIMDTAMRRGFRAGAAAGAGAATADLFYAAIAAGAGSMVVPLLAPIAPVLRIAGGLMLLALAVSGFLALRRSSAPNAAPTAAGERGTFVRFLLLTVVNPLTVVYFAALVLGTGAVASSPAALAAFAAGAFIASLAWQTILAATGSVLGATLPPTARIATGALGNAVVLAFGVLTLASSF